MMELKLFTHTCISEFLFCNLILSLAFGLLGQGCAGYFSHLKFVPKLLLRSVISRQLPHAKLPEKYCFRMIFLIFCQKIYCCIGGCPNLKILFLILSLLSTPTQIYPVTSYTFFIYKNTLYKNTEACFCNGEQQRKHSLLFRTIAKIGTSEPRPKCTGSYKKEHMIPKGNR